jgi:hypothetical protein
MWCHRDDRQDRNPLLPFHAIWTKDEEHAISTGGPILGVGLKDFFAMGTLECFVSIRARVFHTA